MGCLRVVTVAYFKERGDYLTYSSDGKLPGVLLIYLSPSFCVKWLCSWIKEFIGTGAFVKNINTLLVLV